MPAKLIMRFCTIIFSFGSTLAILLVVPSMKTEALVRPKPSALSLLERGFDEFAESQCKFAQRQNPGVSVVDKHNVCNSVVVLAFRSFKLFTM